MNRLERATQHKDVAFNRYTLFALAVVIEMDWIRLIILLSGCWAWRKKRRSFQSVYSVQFAGDKWRLHASVRVYHIYRRIANIGLTKALKFAIKKQMHRRRRHRLRFSSILDADDGQEHSQPQWECGIVILANMNASKPIADLKSVCLWFHVCA